MNFLLLVSCTWDYPEAFDWRIDRTWVLGLRLDPGIASDDIPRTVDALVLSPYPIEDVWVEVCGYVTDQPSYVAPHCFGEPALIQRVANEVPATLYLPPLDYACPIPESEWGRTSSTSSTSGSTSSSYGSYRGAYTWTHTVSTSTSDTGVPDGAFRFPPEACATNVPLRVVARSTEDEASMFTDLFASPVSFEPYAGLDPAVADLQLAIDGDPVAGGEIVLEASVALDAQLEAKVRWWVDDGELLSTGRTYLTDDEGRQRTWNTLRIPADYHGPLRIAVVFDFSRLWLVKTVEVP